MVNNYKCNHCRKVVQRDSEKRWLKSLCGTTGRMTRLWRVKA